MKRNFKIITNQGQVHKRKCFYRVLDIKDSRDFKKIYPSPHRPELILTEEIHFTFFEQLTSQISVQIFKVIKKEIPKTAVLYCGDRYIVNLNDFFIYQFT